MSRKPLNKPLPRASNTLTSNLKFRRSKLHVPGGRNLVVNPVKQLCCSLDAGVDTSQASNPCRKSTDAARARKLHSGFYTEPLSAQPTNQAAPEVSPDARHVFTM